VTGMPGRWVVSGFVVNVDGSSIPLASHHKIRDGKITIDKGNRNKNYLLMNLNAFLKTA
jgi:hypothetical protein